MLGSDSVDEEAAEAVSVTLEVTRSSVSWGSGIPGAVGALDPGAVRACGVGETVAILPGTESRIDALNSLGGLVLHSKGRVVVVLKSGPGLARLIQSWDWMARKTIAVFVSNSGEEYCNSE